MNAKKIKQIQSLKHQKYREKYRQFFIEGKRLVKSAIESETTTLLIIYTNVFYESNEMWLKSINNSYVKQVSSNVFQKVSNTKSPSGIAAVCKLPENKSPDMKNNQWIYLDKISDPGNMGSLIRSAAWFGLDLIALSPGCVDPYNPKVLRSGMGAHFNVKIYDDIPLIQFSNTHEIIACETTGKDVLQFKFPKKHVVVLANEAHGHTKQNKKHINNYITIKKIKAGESLNVSAAGAIIFHQLTLNKL